ncbi:VTT domain-containing protein [Thermofilum pendens]|uniref:VTT domain-containing protein n=1 Tax=Thermofilum pendens (strain DSM 2475 / Hrk 5) TaxID=368408 RepID=A1RX11_THEPD|nr:VTT domain-containing protein [Thermofilum pendens]ABL77741.1 conserved hypothetical protein [Thermofilum pendens Hrk 5]
MHPLLAWLLSIARGVGGYLGIFVISILGNLIPFIPIPYLVAVYLYAAYVPGSNPFLVGVVSGVGAGVGKLLVYLFSRGGARLFMSQESRERFEKIGKMLGNYGAIAVFLFAVTPSPDDAIIIPLGMMGYHPLKFFAAVTAGKIIISIATAFAGKAVFQLAGENFLESLATSIALFVVVMLLIYLLDWEAILSDLGSKGARGFLEDLRREGFSKYMKYRTSAR